ncbi:MAG: thiolase domain-containing protein [Myxococcales bacterium]|nr:thiolase domain-containing protein [Myxococcales bacterium]MCB9534554.1 thiolase domain-containing protein [Myxococcales bacterium]
MKPIRRVFVVGGSTTPFIGKKHPDFVWKGHPDFGKRDNPTLEEHLAAAVNGALEATGVSAEAIDKGYLGNFAGELFANQGHLGAMMPRVNAGLAGKPFTRVEGACASGGLAVIGAIEAIQAGRDVVMAAGVETQTTVSARDGADYLARASHYATERGLDDFTFPAMFARRAKAYQEATGTSAEDIAYVVSKAYANANRNPLAHMRAVKVDHATAASTSDANPCFLKNAELNPYLRMLDCSQVSDGGAALILASEEGLRRLGLSPDSCVELLSYAQSTSGLGQVTDYTRLDNTRLAVAEAYADTGLGAKDMGVAEVHDCFSVTEVLMTEALGFAEYGRGAELAKTGRSAIDGDIPINTGGGLIAFGHPVGATGIKQIFEVARQIRGECGDYQIPTPPKVGITANMGGDDRSTVVTILRG